ncbi:MAG: hypothetical protein H3C48_13365 [Chitinophagaceae bacterium]|nr:hypothetical protein [Chitinophagaceae bacterium]
MVQHYGWILLFTGIVIRYFIERRRFNRRGLGGLQHFRNFERGVIITFLEWLFKWIANAMILFGLFLMLAG